MKAHSSHVVSLLPEAPDHTHWESEDIYYTGDGFFSDLLTELSEASSSIRFETYIFELDDLGQKVLKTLREAAARGVKIKLLVDGVGSPNWNRDLLNELQNAGIEARIFRPYPWVRWGMRFLTRLFNPRRLFRWYRILNRRDHRKIFIIDEKIAYLGSMNVTGAHLYSVKGEEAWRDIGLRVEGGEIGGLVLAFERAWEKGWSPSFERRRWYSRFAGRPQTAFPRLIRLNDNHFLRRQAYRSLLRRIWTSQRILWITSAYFIPQRSLIRALRAAAWGGVDVRVLLSRKSDVLLVRWVSTVIIDWLLGSGVRIYEYLPAILHSKTIIIDDWATIGSSNLNYRSRHLDLEVDAVVLKESSLESLKRNFLRNLHFSEEISLQKWKKEFWWQRFLGRIVFFLRYWM